MKVTKNLKLDCAYLQLRKGRVVQTIELRPGLIFDLDKNGDVIGIEVLSLEKLAPLLEVQKRKVSRAAGQSRRAS